ncbi:F0F1 ATP synthase subunit epsilon [Crocosphaera sp. UHCC 0190]|uniref:F0F1 ATP synthase subunit epsilon n=1 Tax=Crocosphaera sp. UHCC 0190 TaxID=3110246 RepID=UPI002B1EA9D9|nr:F0F1 ATP synthase subunit epsilon [Crocosphaera sp. UHCC 0190]MEA5510140.1 F0F1 ATP synthase subunit epsilon [Crocosphaera sp. UHCC 0190]
MHLKVLIPTEVFIDTTVTKIVAEAENGSFCLLPHHIDFVAALVPGILCYTLESNQEIFLAINEGILVKCGDDVFVSTLQGVADKDLETLKQTVETKFRVLDERERLMRSALAQFEAIIMRRFQDIAM